MQLHERLRSAMKALLLVTDTRRGGTPNKMAAVARGMSARGWDITFVSVMRAGPVLNELQTDGIDTHSLDVTARHQGSRALTDLRRIISNLKPDVLQTALWHADLLGRIVCIRTGVPVVNSHEALDNDKRLRRILADRVTNRLTARHCATCRAVADRVARRDWIPSDRIEIVPNGVDPKRWKPSGARNATRSKLGIPSTAPVVGWVGRLQPVKNLDVLVQAVGNLDETWLLIAGYGEDSNRVQGWVAEAGLTGRVVIEDETSDVASVLEAMDVFCLTSKWEGLPMALMEAMATGLPVVATRVGGIPELITDGLDGLLVEPGDPKATALALEMAFDDPELGRNAAETIRTRFTEEKMVDGIQRLREAVSS